MPFIRNWPIIRKQTCWAAWDFSDGWWSSHAIHSTDVIFKVDCNRKLKGVVPILPNHLGSHLKSSKQQRNMNMEINALKSTTKDARKREKTMRCSSWLQEQHTRGTAETYLTRSTQMKLHRPCLVSKYYYIQNCPAILKLSHICIALHLGGGNQLSSLIWSWWSNASSPYETILRKKIIHIYMCSWWRKHYKCEIHRKMYVWYRECHHTSLNIIS
jgi:hypothetical protein